jgi:hypothetical protein
LAQDHNIFVDVFVLAGPARERQRSWILDDAFEAADRFLGATRHQRIIVSDGVMSRT